MIPEGDYKFIDLNYLNDMGGGDDEFTKEVIGICLNTIPESIDKLMAAVVANDTAQLYFYIHKLRGSMNVINSPQFIKLLDKADAYCKANDMSSVIEIAAQLSTNANEILGELREVLGKMG